MTRVAVISDVHSNLQALRAVLREVDDLGVESIAVAGDVIGNGGRSRECIESLRERGALAVLGNHEFFIELMDRHGLAEAELDEGPGWLQAARQLSPEQMQWIRELNLVEQLAPGCVMAHASLHDQDRWRYLVHRRDARSTLDMMMERGIELAFFGHTHLQRGFAHPKAPAQPIPVGEDEDGGVDQWFLPEGSICAFTVGSVGEPREAERDVATWTLWDQRHRTVEFRITSLVDSSAACARTAAARGRAARR